MRTAVLCLISLILLSVSCQVLSSCQQSRSAFQQKGYNATLVPDTPVSGQFLQLCSESTSTCCNSVMESTFENATRARLAQYYPPNFITDMLDRIVTVVDDESYDPADQVVTTALSAVVNTVNPRHRGATLAVIRNMEEEMKAIHGDGKNETTLNILMNEFFSKVLIFRLSSNLTLSSSDYNRDLYTCMAGNAMFSITEPTKMIYEQLHSLFILRDVFIEMYDLAVDLDLEFDPFTECVRAYSELFHCQTCVPLEGVPTAMPCKNACKNVMIGCTGFFERFRNFVRSSEEQARVLNDNSLLEEKSFHDAILRLSREIEKINDLENDRIPALVAQINSCKSSSSTNARRRRHAVEGRLGARRYLRQLSGAVDDTNRITGIPHSLTTTLYDAVFVRMEEEYFSRFDGLSLRIAGGECDSLPSSNCWNQVSVGADTSQVVSPGEDSITNNPNLRSKGDTDIEDKKEVIEDQEEELDKINERKNDLLGITEPDASSPTSVKSAVVVVAAVIAAIFMQVL